jgi:sugar phosphate permease
MVAPVYTLYFMRGLGASDGWIGMNGTLANLTPILGFYVWQHGINRWGENRVLKSTIILLGLYPLAVGLAPGLTAILLCTAINGLFTPAVNLSHFSMLLKICPGDLRPQFLGYWSAVMNIGAFIMPMVGVYLSNRFGFAPVLVLGGLMCLAGSSTFVFRPLRTPDSRAARQAEIG